MVGIHGEIMENERENLHQLPEARDEVFALVVHNFPWIPTIIFLSWGT